MSDCRICSKESTLVLDLGAQPIANSLLKSKDQSEMIYPLEFYWCSDCQFGQVNDLPVDRIFGEDYPYYSSVNKSYVDQCRDWAQGYLKHKNPKSVIEIGSNDGYMLDNFKHLNHLGYEPSVGPASVAEYKGIKVVKDFFKRTDHFYADLIIANNVLAHTPKLHELVEAMAKSLTLHGEVVIEFPDVRNMIDFCQFDTIYHEHYSYFSIKAIEKLFAMHGLHLNKYDELISHGGSIRAYFSKRNEGAWANLVIDIKDFAAKTRAIKFSELNKITNYKIYGNSIALFGAAAKGNTFLNYLGVSSDMFDYVVDETPAKQGKYLPGSHIPIVGMNILKESQPDLLYILPWNFKDEIIKKTEFINSWGGVHSWRR